MAQDDMSGYTVVRQLDKWSKINLEIHQWRLSEVTNGNESLIMKEFHPSVASHFQQEAAILQAIKGAPYTVQIHSKKTQTPNDLRSFIFLKGRSKASMKDYLDKYGKIDERISKILVRQVLLSLNHAYGKQIIHKRIQLKDILITRQDMIQVAGWQETLPHNQQSLQELMFSCGELIIAMLTKHPPFNTYTKNDPHYKFISDKYIEMFWQSISRQFPHKCVGEDLKLLVSNLFLRKIESFDQIIYDYKWLKIQLSTHLEMQQIGNYFQKKQIEHQQRKLKKIQQKKQFKQKVEIFREEFQGYLRGDFRNQKIQNQQEYLNFIINQNQLNINSKKLQDKTIQGYFIIHQKIDYVLAYIKYLFTQCIKNKKNIIPQQDQQYLQSENLVIQNNEVLISLGFKNKSEQLSDYDLRMKFFKTENKEIAAQIQVEKQKETYVSQSIIYYIKNQIEQLNESIQKNKKQKI